MSYIVLARKWRPRKFNDVVGQYTQLKALKNSINNKQMHHSYLFTGIRGVGKTTIARILSKCLICEKGITATPCDNCFLCKSVDQASCVDVIEVDAASRTKVEDTRELLDNVPYAPAQGRFKIYIIDEVHMLSKYSFNALLKTLEEPPEHVKFILATTDPQKLPDTILSRCIQFHLRSLTLLEIRTHIEYILEQEQISFESLEVLEQIAIYSNGSLRDSLNLLEQIIAFGNNKVTSKAIAQYFSPFSRNHAIDLLKKIISGDIKQALLVVRNIIMHNIDLNLVLKSLQKIIYQTSLAQILPTDFPQEIIELSERVEASDLQLFYQTTLLGVRDLPYAPDIVVGFEMIILRMMYFKPKLSNVEDIIKTNNKNLLPSSIKEDNTTINLKNCMQILRKLNLQGISKIIVEHCKLQSVNKNKIVLELEETQKHLLNDKHVKIIQHALQDYLHNKVQLHIKIGSTLNNQPDIIVKKNIQSDQNFQKMIDAFDAKIIDLKNNNKG